jgi:Na+(H+)/acetate symporter ActP
MTIGIVIALGLATVLSALLGALLSLATIASHDGQ